MSQTLKQAAASTGLTMFYLRKCIHEGKLEAKQEQIAGTEVRHWVISDEALTKFESREKKQIGRSDGRNLYIAYLTPEELELLNNSMIELSFAAECLPRRKNPSKKSAE